MLCNKEAKYYNTSLVKIILSYNFSYYKINKDITY